MSNPTKELRVQSLTSPRLQRTSRYTQSKSLGESRASLGVETPYKALVQKVQGSIPRSGIPFVKVETAGIDEESMGEDDDDEGESEEGKEM